MSLAYFWLFLLLLAAGMPLAFAFLVGPGLGLLMDGESAFFPVLLSRLYNGIDSFPLMAVPFFVLAGEIMNSGGVTVTLIRFSRAMIGHVRGGLAQVNILCSLLFAGMSGSAVADASALGRVLVPAMTANGYARGFAAAVTAASAVIGPIIPPSGIMILYAYVMDLSVAALFAAGLLPGLLIAAGLMTATWLIARARDFPVADRRASWSERAVSFRRSIFALLTPLILLGGILGGIFTPTEAAAVSAGYALLVSLFLYRSLRVQDLPAVFITAARRSGIILFLVGSAVVFAWIVTVSGVGARMEAALAGLLDRPLLLLLCFNLLLVLVGMFLDAGPAILLLGPVLGPLFVKAGVDPLHFATIMCVNLTVGLATPPVGLALFVSADVADESPERVARAIWPFVGVQIVVLLALTYIPWLSLWLPRQLGFH